MMNGEQKKKKEMKPKPAIHPQEFSSEPQGEWPMPTYARILHDPLLSLGTKKMVVTSEMGVEGKRA